MHGSFRTEEIPVLEVCEPQAETAPPTCISPGAAELPECMHACVDCDDLTALYEDVDWVGLKSEPLPSRSRRRIASQVDAVRRVPIQFALAALQEEPNRVQHELQEWLGPQYSTLSQGKAVDMVEVFTGKAPLSSCSERVRDGVSIRIGTSEVTICRSPRTDAF